MVASPDRRFALFLAKIAFHRLAFTGGSWTFAMGRHEPMMFAPSRILNTSLIARTIFVGQTCAHAVCFGRNIGSSECPIGSQSPSIYCSI